MKKDKIMRKYALSKSPFCDRSSLKDNSNSPALVRERTIPTERQPLIDEDSANFWGIEVCRVVSAADPLRP
jgi:hypothetical protein